MSRVDFLNKKNGIAYIFSALIDCHDNGNISGEEAAAIKELKNDSRIIAGRPLSAISSAVLDFHEIEKYTGNDEDTINLINDWNK